MENSIYLGTERVGKLLRQFAFPCICSLIISCLYNIVDQIFVGNGIGYLGNAATGVIFPITVVGWGFSQSFGDGMPVSDILTFAISVIVITIIRLSAKGTNGVMKPFICFSLSNLFFF